MAENHSIARWCVSAAVTGAALLGATLPAGEARGDDFVDRVNAVYRGVAPAKRSDVVLLPLLAKMQAPPASVNRLEKARLLPLGGPGWEEASAWAAAEPQQAVIRGLDQITKETDWQKSFAFGQPYGVDGVTSDLVRAKLYTELGDPPTLAAAQHMYLPAMDKMAMLANVEATRLAGEGKVSEATDVLADLAFFGRQMADRQFEVEARWGMQTTAESVERLRDVVHTDFRGGAKLEAPKMLELIERLDEEGYLDMRRLVFPRGNATAAEQVVTRVYVPRGGVDERVFAGTMSSLGTAEYPLRLFSEAARWRTAAAVQANQQQASDKVRGVWQDWAARWPLDAFDRRLTTPTVFSRLDGAMFASIKESSPSMSDLFELRRIVTLEAMGTRQAIAVVGQNSLYKNFPNVLTAVRPQWLKVINPDPFAIDRATLLQYFVPERDQYQKDRRAVQTGHEMEVFLNTGENFRVLLLKDTFVLYGTGGDGANNFAARIQNTVKRTSVQSDYLIWPPVLSLYRQHLIDSQDPSVFKK